MQTTIDSPRRIVTFLAGDGSGGAVRQVALYSDRVVVHSQRGRSGVQTPPQVRLRDDLGTRYEAVRGDSLSTAQWEERTFVPGVPDDAGDLTVVSGPDEVRVALGSNSADLAPRP